MAVMWPTPADPDIPKLSNPGQWPACSHNPKVAGSNPAPASNPFNNLRPANRLKRPQCQRIANSSISLGRDTPLCLGVVCSLRLLQFSDRFPVGRSRRRVLPGLFHGFLVAAARFAASAGESSVSCRRICHSPIHAAGRPLDRCATRGAREQNTLRLPPPGE